MSEVSFCRFETDKTDISDTCRFHLFSLVVFCRKKFSSAESFVVSNVTSTSTHAMKHLVMQMVLRMAFGVYHLRLTFYERYQ